VHLAILLVGLQAIYIHVLRKQHWLCLEVHVVNTQQNACFIVAYNTHRTTVARLRPQLGRIAYPRSDGVESS
jgi:hypothetical protein